MPDYVRSHELRSVTAGANLVSGDVVLTSDRMVGYVEAQRGIANTEVGFVRVRGVVRFTKASSSEVIAAGDRIQYNTTTKLVSRLQTPATRPRARLSSALRWQPPETVSPRLTSISTAPAKHDR
jgi:hypothetical protein